MKYLAFYVWFEGCGVNYGTDLEELKKPWCWQTHIFECGEHDAENKVVIPKEGDWENILSFLITNFKKIY